ncbi:MAG: PHP domain-containing protein, partial [Candidatus Poribacteria bacterium]|nr:PHP domain-containing protein [Candidatus Poribacteria bacterium]
TKTIVQIEEGLRFLEVQDRMRPLWRILQIAQAIIQILRDAPGIARADFTGEMRRHEEMLHQLELTVKCTSPATIVDALCKVGGVKGFETAENAVFGGGCVAATVDGGFPLRVYAFDSEAYEAGLLLTTASAEHLTALNGVAEAHHLEKSEGGLADWMRGKTESSIYDAVALPLIPPELRRDGTSIEAAAAGALPTLIELSDIRGDLHMHTEWSDGRHSMREMVEAAQACGHDYIAITDHSVSSRVANGLTLERLQAHMNEVRSINEEVSGIEVLAGSEVDILNDGNLDFTDDVLAQLDIVVASVHAGFNMSEADMTKRMIRGIENPHVNIIGHPTGRLLGRRPGYALNLDAVIQAAAEHRVVLEINASSNRLDLEPDMARKANEAGALLTINTDAHAVPQLQQTCFGINVARRAWLTKDAVINTYSLDKLRDLLQARNA